MAFEFEKSQLLRYQEVDKGSFGKDISEIRTMIKKPGSIMPKFMVVKDNESVEE